MFTPYNPNFVYSANCLSLGGLYELHGLDKEDFDVLLNVELGRTLSCCVGTDNDKKSWYDSKFVMALFNLTENIRIENGLLNMGLFPVEERCNLFGCVGGCRTYGAIVNLRTGALSEVSTTNGKGWRRF